jgi:anti-sigma factor RsiW
MSKHLGDKLIDYAWGTLTPQDQSQAEAHLHECADCRTELERHQALVGQLARTVPMLAPPVPDSVRGGWADVAARVPQLRPASAPRRHGLPGFVAVGLAMSAAAAVLVAVMAQAWLYQPPLDATAFVASSTPTASATYTPERATRVATPVSWMYVARLQSPRPLPVAATAKP